MKIEMITLCNFCQLGSFLNKLDHENLKEILQSDNRDKIVTLLMRRSVFDKPKDYVDILVTAAKNDAKLSSPEYSSRVKCVHKNKVKYGLQLQKTGDFVAVCLSDSSYNVAWIRDKHIHTCMLCEIPFSMMNRKHHCRVCGFIICGHCSRNRSKLTELDALGVERNGSRCCDKCSRTDIVASNPETDSITAAQSMRTPSPVSKEKEDTRQNSAQNITAPTVIIDAASVGSSSGMSHDPNSSFEALKDQNQDEERGAGDGDLKDRGEYISVDGSAFKGKYSGEVASGQGTFTSVNGDVYKGELKDGVTHGRGVFKFADGDVYDGEYKDGLKHGRGVYTYASGSVYTGGFINGKYCGQGVLKYANGSIYEGAWEDDKFHGHGVFSFMSGSIYDGEYKHDKKDGQGLLILLNGASYSGGWKDNKQHGHGVFKYSDGDEYEGDFRSGQRHGNGVFKYASGEVYEGAFKNGKRHGRGVYRYSDGSVYEGEWSHGNQHGQGVLKSANGHILYEGIWDNGHHAM